MSLFARSFTEAMTEDFADVPDVGRLTQVGVRLLVAALLGGVLGYQRETIGKAAGLRTYMLVSAGAAMFTLVPQTSGMDDQALSRVLQGIIAGIGFLGGGAILKDTSEQKIHGMTTAAGIWFAAAIGIAAGAGRIGSACLGTFLAYLILAVLVKLHGPASDDSA